LRKEAMGVLVEFVGGVERQLLSAKINGRSSWLDPAKPITKSRIVDCARHLGLTEGEVFARYRALADEFGLKIQM